MSASAPIRLGTLPEPTTVSVVMAIKDEAAFAAFGEQYFFVVMI